MQMKKNNQKQKAIETKTVIKRKPAYLYHEVEQWLTEMGLQGWHLIVRDGRSTYIFEKGKPQYKEYFIWDMPRQRESVKYDISHKYPFLKKTFGVNSKISKLKKYNYIIEVDLDKINSNPKLHAEYQAMKQYRNRMYTKRALNNWIFVTIYISVIVLLSILLATGVIPSTFQPSWA